MAQEQSRFQETEHTDRSDAPMDIVAGDRDPESQLELLVPAVSTSDFERGSGSESYSLT